MTTDVKIGTLSNVRDLGGAIGLDGRSVRMGMLFRASSLHRLTEEDEAAWRETEMAEIIDLRYARERNAFPLPEFIDEHRHFPLLPDHWHASPEERAKAPAVFLCSVYNDMIDLGAQTVRDIIALLQSEDSYPTIFFCMAGKDRTGVVAAIILALLGVDSETIADDFERSGEPIVALVRELREKGTLEDHPMMNQPEELLRAPRSAMEMFLEDVARRFGSLEGYVRDIGVPEEQIERLRELLLEPATV